MTAVSPRCVQGDVSQANVVSTENQKVKFSGAYQIRTNDMNDARVCFQPGGKANPARIEKADLVIIYCEQASARSPAAMKSYEKYLTSKGKKQDVVLLEGGIAAYKALFPNDKSTLTAYFGDAQG